jgi:hypothetical protein
MELRPKRMDLRPARGAAKARRYANPSRSRTSPPPSLKKTTSFNKPCCSRRLETTAQAEVLEAAAPAGVAVAAAGELLEKGHHGPGGRQKPCTTQAQRMR